MVVGNPCRHDNHDGSLLLYDEGTHGVDDVRPFLPHVQRLVLERTFRVGTGDLGQAVMLPGEIGKEEYEDKKRDMERTES